MKGEWLSIYRFYICAAIFILLSAAKVFLPQHSENLREQVINIIDANDDYPEMVEALGKCISQTGLSEELVRVLNMNSDSVEVFNKNR